MRDERSFMLSLEVDEIDESASWAVWEALGAELSCCLPVRALTTLLHESQHRLLARVCGPRWQPQRGVPAPFACPNEACGAQDDFARKGRRSRLRRLDTAVGVVTGTTDISTRATRAAACTSGR